MSLAPGLQDLASGHMADAAYWFDGRSEILSAVPITEVTCMGKEFNAGRRSIGMNGRTITKPVKSWQHLSIPNFRKRADRTDGKAAIRRSKRDADTDLLVLSFPQ
jgi:hypothetical protein